MRPRSQPAMSVGLVLAAAMLALPGAAAAVETPSATSIHGLLVSAAPDHDSPDMDTAVEQQVLDELAADETTDFWVYLRDQADLNATAGSTDRDAQGRFVYAQLTENAAASQASLLELLDAEGVDYQSFWIANTVKVTGKEELLDRIAELPQVEQVTADRVYEIPEPAPAEEEPRINTAEWGIDRVNAPQVWDTYGTRGEGIVVGSIDSGVRFDHPALVSQYRGNNGDGTFDHNYNWHDPSNICGHPSLRPCDNNGHGTHVTGTMVGDDEGGNRIGAAPGAKWIAAKGCETNTCSQAALLSAGQFMLAPTDLQGNNANPELRPHILNNSWSGSTNADPWYQSTVQAWVAAGIFPQFANGNTGPRCGSAGNPGNLPESYSAGSFDINNNIAASSGRGPSAWDDELIKPNIAAPGVNVRSAWNDGGYRALSGTSMASPHVSGTVALIWSAAPTLIRDIDSTREMLNVTATDADDLTCGGEPDNNNVWGQGRLDAFAAVEQAAAQHAGDLAGTMRDAETGDPIVDATVSFEVDGFPRSTSTDGTGAYQLTLPAGSYDVTASAFGFLTKTATDVDVVEGGTTVQNFSLPPASIHAVSGRVVNDEGNPVAGGTVTIVGTPVPPAIIDEDGSYSFDRVPAGEYQVRAGGRCQQAQTRRIVVDGEEILDFGLPPRTDSFGYLCRTTAFTWIDGSTELSFDSPSNATARVDMHFPFPFYGTTYTTAHVSTNGFLSFLGPTAAPANGTIPSTTPPNGAIYPFWDDLLVDDSARVLTESLGQAPNRRFVVEWRNVGYADDPARRLDFETILFENGHIVNQYRNLADDPREQGNAATVGIEMGNGIVATQYSFDEPSVQDGLAIQFRVPPSAIVTGDITDTNDGGAVRGTTVRALQDGVEVRRAVTGADGTYRLAQLPLGTYTVEAQAHNYESALISVTVSNEDQVVTEDFSLRTARAEVSQESLELIAVPGQSKATVVNLKNTGSVDMAWAFQGVTERMSVATDGAEANTGLTSEPSISGDGGQVAFHSQASSLVPGDTNAAQDIFVHDRDTGATERMSVASDGTEGNGDSAETSVSADGRFVAFNSLATNLVPGQNETPRRCLGSCNDVFVHDRVTGVTERVSVASDGTEANNHSHNPALSADGRYVAFYSHASDLVPGQSDNSTANVFVHDRETGTTERVSVASDGTEGNGFSFTPSLSADGRFVSFHSLASNLVADDTNETRDIFVHDRETGTTARVSVASDGIEGNGLSESSSISADGRYVGFNSSASNLVPGDTNGRTDVFVHDRETGVTERMSVATDGTEGTATSLGAAVSADGRFVTFSGSSSNLVPDDTNTTGDIFVRDRLTGTTERVSVASDGTESDRGSGTTAISDDGQTVAFGSLASNLVPGDANGTWDVFVHDRGFGTVPWISKEPASGTLAPGASQAIEVTVDATGLEPGHYTTTLPLVSNSGRQPVLRVPVSLVVPADRQGVNSGGGAYSDGTGDVWAADQAFDGSFGHDFHSGRTRTTRPIAGTNDDALYQSARIGTEFTYRFDDLANGIYEVDLHFAEIQRKRPGKRIFDVAADGTMLLDDFDIAADVEVDTAAVHRFSVEVTDGRLRVLFRSERGSAPAIVNAIRVTHRPDAASG